MSAELEIIDLVVGEGKEAVKGALITTHYTGWLEDGTKFDSSLDRGNYFETVIGTGRVIKGWDQGIMGMKVGGNVNLWYLRIWLMVNAKWAISFLPIRI